MTLCIVDRGSSPCHEWVQQCTCSRYSLCYLLCRSNSNSSSTRSNCYKYIIIPWPNFLPKKINKITLSFSFWICQEVESCFKDGSGAPRCFRKCWSRGQRVHASLCCLHGVTTWPIEEKKKITDDTVTSTNWDESQHTHFLGKWAMCLPICKLWDLWTKENETQCDRMSYRFRMLPYSAGASNVYFKVTAKAVWAIKLVGATMQDSVRHTPNGSSTILIRELAMVAIISLYLQAMLSGEETLP